MKPKNIVGAMQKELHLTRVANTHSSKEYA